MRTLTVTFSRGKIDDREVRRITHVELVLQKVTGTSMVGNLTIFTPAISEELNEWLAASLEDFDEWEAQASQGDDV